jgi:hypothetical protein
MIVQPIKAGDDRWQETPLAALLSMLQLVKLAVE